MSLKGIELQITIPKTLDTGQAEDDDQRTKEEEKKAVHPYKGSFVGFNR